MILPGMPRMMPMVGGTGGFPAGTTWNPSDKASDVTLSNGNLTAAKSGSSQGGVRATSAISGKVYWEYVADEVYSTLVGIGTSSASLTTYLGASSSGWGWQHTGIVRNDGTESQTIATYVAGDVLGVAVDMDNLKLHFAKNGTWQASSNPAAGTGGFNVASSVWLPMISLYSTAVISTVSANFNGPFTYPVPSGFNLS